MNATQILLDQFIAATCRIDKAVTVDAHGIYVSPHVHAAIKAARKLLPMLNDAAVKNQVARLLHDIYTDLRADIKLRGVNVNGCKHPALDPSLQVYRIIIT